MSRSVATRAYKGLREWKFLFFLTYHLELQKSTPRSLPPNITSEILDTHHNHLDRNMSSINSHFKQTADTVFATATETTSASKINEDTYCSDSPCTHTPEQIVDMPAKDFTKHLILSAGDTKKLTDIYWATSKDPFTSILCAKAGASYVLTRIAESPHGSAQDDNELQRVSLQELLFGIS